MQTIKRTKKIYIGKKRGAKSKGADAREKTCPFKISHLQEQQYYALPDERNGIRAWVCDEPYKIFSQRLAIAVEQNKQQGTISENMLAEFEDYQKEKVVVVN